MPSKAIIGNWKMNKGPSETQSFLRTLKKVLSPSPPCIVGVAPPFISLSAAAGVLAGSPIRLVAQNVGWEDSGAFTGEVSAPMLKEVGCKMVIVGHSERRQFFGETNRTVNLRIRHALKHGLEVIFCLGETLQERERGDTINIVRTQFQEGLQGLTKKEGTNLYIAYEPVWAIGTGRTATPEQAQEVHLTLRSLVRDAFGPEVSQSVRLLYGGSVKPDNVSQLCGQKDIDGALVGGASLDIEPFLALIKLGCGA